MYQNAGNRKSLILHQQISVLYLSPSILENIRNMILCTKSCTVRKHVPLL